MTGTRGTNDAATSDQATGDQATSDQVRAMYRRWIEELWGGDLQAGDALVSEDFVGHWPGREVRGRAELLEVVAQTRGMFEAMTFTVLVGPVVEEDLVAARWSGRGTSGEGVTDFVGNDLLRVRDGRFVEYWPATTSGS